MDPLKFNKATTRRLYEEIAMEIRRAIVAGKLKPGDFLPSEGSMAEQFGTSRTTIREALRVLELAGFVETKRGKGTCVSDALAPGKLANLLPPNPRERRLMRELMEFRLIIEPYCARMAAQSASPDTISAIEKAVADIKREVDEGGTGEAQALRFHQLIVKSAGNGVVAYAWDAITELQKLSRRLTYSVPGRPEMAYREHLSIFQAIKARDPITAEGLCISHLETVLRLLESLPGASSETAR